LQGVTGRDTGNSHARIKSTSDIQILILRWIHRAMGDAVLPVTRATLLPKTLNAMGHSR